MATEWPNQKSRRFTKLVNRSPLFDRKTTTAADCIEPLSLPQYIRNAEPRALIPE